MANKEIKILPMIYDMILWFSPKISKYPKKYKYTIGDRITDTQLSILERIIEAKYSPSNKKKYFLRQSNLLIEKLRFMVRLSKDLQCITLKEYEYSSKILNEIGKMIGGWEKWTESNGSEV